MPTFVDRASEAAGEAGHVLPAPDLGPDDRSVLLDVARSALRYATSDVPADDIRDAVEAARARVGDVRAAAFVTLLVGADLRGCMGLLEDALPVPDTVADAALKAATSDPRFRPVQAAELRSIHVEISVLGPFAVLADPGAIVPGLDGVVVESAGRAGLLLPEVAVDQGWDGRQLLEAACDKAWLPRDAWRDPGTRLHVFRTVRFGGSAALPASAGSSRPAS